MAAVRHRRHPVGAGRASNAIMAVVRHRRRRRRVGAGKANNTIMAVVRHRRRRLRVGAGKASNTTMAAVRHRRRHRRVGAGRASNTIMAAIRHRRRHRTKAARARNIGRRLTDRIEICPWRREPGKPGRQVKLLYRGGGWDKGPPPLAFTQAPEAGAWSASPKLRLTRCTEASTGRVHPKGGETPHTEKGPLAISASRSCVSCSITFDPHKAAPIKAAKIGFRKKIE